MGYGLVSWRTQREILTNCKLDVNLPINLEDFSQQNDAGGGGNICR